MCEHLCAYFNITKPDFPPKEGEEGEGGVGGPAAHCRSQFAQPACQNSVRCLEPIAGVEPRLLTPEMQMRVGQVVLNLPGRAVH